jgi:hypothetical protein
MRGEMWCTTTEQGSTAIENAHGNRSVGWENPGFCCYGDPVATLREEFPQNALSSAEAIHSSGIEISDAAVDGSVDQPQRFSVAETVKKPARAKA